jgi:N utilization substance protein B
MRAGTPSRRVSRGLAFQTLYGQEFVACASLEDLRQAFAAAPRPDDGDDAPNGGDPSGFAWELVRGVWQNKDELDSAIGRFALNWRLERVGRVELTLLRLAVYELLYRPDTPPGVIINEALELNRQFGEEKSRAFVNGILDAAGKALRGDLRPGADGFSAERKV